LGEVEVVLRQHAAVRQAVASAQEDGSGNNRIVAYVVPNPPSAPTVAELKSFVKQKLPDYMVPSIFVMLDFLPVTPNGKVDRYALPVPETSRAALGARYVAPRTPTEGVVADIWAEVLKVDKVGVFDNFFDLGGHSLLATQMLSRICDKFQIWLPLRTLFEQPTVSDLAEQVGRTETITVANNKMTDLLAEIESLSEAQAQKLASKHRSKDQPS
jgi:acyl carrier protein